MLTWMLPKGTLQIPHAKIYLMRNSFSIVKHNLVHNQYFQPFLPPLFCVLKHFMQYDQTDVQTRVSETVRKKINYLLQLLIKTKKKLLAFGVLQDPIPANNCEFQTHTKKIKRTLVRKFFPLGDLFPSCLLQTAFFEPSFSRHCRIKQDSTIDQHIGPTNVPLTTF